MSVKYSDERIKKIIANWIQGERGLPEVGYEYNIPYNTLYNRAVKLLRHIHRLPSEARVLIRERGITDYFTNNPASLCNKPERISAQAHAKIASMKQHAAPVDAQGGSLKLPADLQAVRELVVANNLAKPENQQMKSVADFNPPKKPAPSETFGKRIGVLFDMQVKPNVNFDYLAYYGHYFAKKQVDEIICIGDFADMSSLSFHDEPGSKNYEGQRYREDILAVHHAMKIFMEPIIAEKNRSGWNPKLVMTLGNHEHRIDRTIAAIPKLDGTIGLPDLEYERWGFEVFPFLVPYITDNVAFCHYFPSGIMGRPCTTARQLLNKMHMSCVAGHQPGRDIAYSRRANGREMTAIINGASYDHDEHFLNHQTNRHFRGIYILNDVIDGEFEEMPVSLKYLRRKYGSL